MHRVCLLLLSPYILLATIACQSGDQQNIAESNQWTKSLAPPDSAWWTSSGIQLQPTGSSYEQEKANVNQARRALNVGFQKGNVTLDSVRSVFTQCLLNRIIPYWYGTSWSFSGHTPMPQQGNIACGYFISTTLQDVGIRLNRYRLAQQSPLDEAEILSMGDTIRGLQHSISDSAVAVLKIRLREGLYFVGLGDSHVCYLLKWHGELLLIHSNYTTPAEVVIQPVTQSVFIGYNQFYISDITHNDRLLQTWLKGTEIPTKNVAKATITTW